MSKILVIEDDSLIQSNLYDLLTTEEYEVECANNGMEGIDKVREFFPDLIICDIMMPKMTGFEVLEELQKDDETAGIPFLFLTAKTEMENLRHGMRLGADDYLLKPFDVDEVLEAIKTRIRKKEIGEARLKEMQEQIAHKIPHDLRTPLVPILGFSEMIENEDDITEIKEMIKKIKDSGKTLHNRIEKFLLYKDLVLNEIKKNDDIANPRPSEISREYVELCVSKIAKDNLTSERFPISIDTAQLKISEWYLNVLITELVENSLKYSTDDTTIEITGKESEGYYELSVKDYGIGMTKSQINSITAFKKFSADSIPEPGLGLGLVILKKIMSLHNGSFNITSEKDKYTDCRLRIPIV